MLRYKVDFCDDEDSLGGSKHGSDAAKDSALWGRKNNFVKSQQDAVKNGLHIIRNFQCTNNPTPNINPVVPYKYRILDAISRLFHIESKLACVSVAVPEKELIVAFNTTGKFKKSEVESTQEKIKALFALLKSNDSLDCYYTLVEYCLKNEHKFYLSEKEAMQDSLEKVLKLMPQNYIQELIGDFYNLLGTQYNTFGEFANAFEAIVNTYNTIRTKISQPNTEFVPDSDISEDSDSSSDDSSQDLNEALEIIKKDKSRILDLMAKLEQDCYKVSQYFPQYVKVASIKFLENARGNAHSELRILEELGSKASYIGCSKLSCFFCDTILSQDETEDHKVHLGGHGIAYAMDNNDLPEILFTGRYQGAINNILSEVARCYAADISASSEPDASLQYAPTSPFIEILGADATADL
jgi:tetratricopeptide (TPR) repeat protein